MEPQTLPDLFTDAVENRRRADCFQRYDRDRGFVPVASEEARDRVARLARGLRALGVERGDRVVILAENRVEWALADLAVLCRGAVSVPLHAVLLADTIDYVLCDCEPKAILVSGHRQAEKLLTLRDRRPFLRAVVAFDPVDLPGTIDLAQLEALGGAAGPAGDSDAELRPSGLTGRDLASIIYTSGTTGKPKGVMLEHRNMVANAHQAQEILHFTAADSTLSFLPLSHVFERTCGLYTMLLAGASIAYAEKMETVPRDLKLVRPTILISVPRLFEKIHARVVSHALDAGGLKRAIFTWAAAVGKAKAGRVLAGERSDPWLAARWTVADRLVFTRLRAALGGRVKFAVSGAAPLNQQVGEFFVGAGVPLFEGYGLTEASPVLAVNRPGHQRLGSVGAALPSTELRIADDGEILARGPQVMRGYWNDAEATAEALDRDGWLHTGDVGRLDADGFLYITDRKKDLIVTSGGKNVAPQPLEVRLCRSEFVQQAVVVGDKRPFLCALLVPEFAALEAWAAKQGLETGDRAALLATGAVFKLYQGLLAELNRELPGFNQIKRYVLLERELTVEAGELTPTLKVKRFAVAERYRDRIDAVYPDQGALSADAGCDRPG
ncbi:MAG TPA: long-chain fatty acid--CoA ligase [Candidatus Krumholzibacteria bacterium]|nr:long-chain fatty acid--CoA ligase [Candidatus Krumholzibacteria bacterium]HPD71216.1 long-chain fatty acid--CoA ligase [Candidatus Krumholzibacteria bacterium]HRY39084.1 long-chain fatty acid--CoA ligase [Candidatus Krumholzibacteria bacterium]